METKDSNTAMRGRVRGRWVNGAAERPLFDRANQLSFGCCTVLAHLMAWDTSFMPTHMGFIYGDSGSTASLLNPTTARGVTWDTLAAELGDSGVHGNIQIVPLTMTPALVTDGADYDKNAVMFTAHTRTGADAVYAFPLASPNAGELTTGCHLYHAVLLAHPGPGVYIPVARVTLGDAGPVYHTKPSGFELALDWQISFL